MASLLTFDSETRRIVREGVPSEMNPFDVLGMAAVAKLKETMAVEAVALTMGPPQAREVLVQCLAMGADRAVHLVDRAFAGSDTLATARALALALRRESFDLVVCGRNSVDSETAQVGPEIAELLEVPQVTGVRRLEVAASGDAITVERITDEGHEVVQASLPALITVTEEVAPELYPSTEELESAREGPIVEVAASDLSQDTSIFGLEGSPTSVRELYSVEPERERIVVRDRPVEEAVASLMEFLDARGVFEGEGRADAPRTPRGPRRRSPPASAIWVVAEVLGDRLRPVTLELLGRACELAPSVDASVEAVLLGDSVRRHVPTLAAYGADVVHLAEAPELAHYDTNVHAHVLAAAIGSDRPFAVLLASTANGRDLAPRLAARLGLGLTGDCIGLEIDDRGMLVQLKPAFAGNTVAPILSRTVPQMATVRQGVLVPVDPDWSVEPVVRELSRDGLPRPGVDVLRRVVDSSTEGADLEHARVVVTVGKGVESPENIEIVRGLQRALGASLGATREVTDVGWLPRQHQIGLSGKSVSPDLYVAVAVRGPFNHTVGIQKAGTVVAVNTSARAPIFRAADFGIVGDYAEVVPALVRAIEGRRPA